MWLIKQYSLSDTILKVLRQGSQIRHEYFVFCLIKRKVLHGVIFDTRKIILDHRRRVSIKNKLVCVMGGSRVRQLKLLL